MLRIAVVLTLLFFGSMSPAAAADLSGCWSGTWESCCTGHHGPLNATFVKCNEQQYQVTFSGRFFKIMPFRYQVTLDAVDEGETVKLSGNSYLGRLMGTFSYSAEATACQFNSSYSSCKDQGWFRLQKCSCTACN